MPLDYSLASSVDPHVKVLLHGQSGSGKSWAAAKAGSGDPRAPSGRVAILLLEANGLASVRASNPAAIVVRAYDPGAYGKSDVWEVVREFFADAQSGALAAAGVTSIVVDSLTELQRVWRDMVLVEDGVERKRLALHKMTQQQWGIWTERFRRLIRALRDLPYHVVAIALSQNEKDEEGNVTGIVPAFEGQKLPGEIAQYFTAVGYAYKRMVKTPGPDGVPIEQVEHRVLFQGAEKFRVKPCPGLRNVEDPEPSAWFAAYARAIVIAVAPTPTASTAPAAHVPDEVVPAPARAAEAAAQAAPASTSADPVSPVTTSPDAAPATPATGRSTRRRLGVAASTTPAT